MSIESDVVDVLEAAGLTIAPSAVEQEVPPPFVVYRSESDPLMTLQGYAGATRSVFTFESWATTKNGALASRAAVQAAIDAAFATLAGYREPPGEGAYDPEADMHMEPCAYSFWHA